MQYQFCYCFHDPQSKKTPAFQSGFSVHCQKAKTVVRAATAPTATSTCETLQLLHLWAVPTSKRYCRDGTSTAVKSAKDLNWALVWSRRKVRTGMIPSGWIKSSSSLKQVTCWKPRKGHEYKHQQDWTLHWIQQSNNGNFHVILTIFLAQNFWKQLTSSVFTGSCPLPTSEQFLKEHLPVLVGYTWAESQLRTLQKHRAASVLLHFLVWQ